uniref:Ig-like domain-containing protein n=1 Tax=Castor canadensis TaxID=51338 RepID=A0A8C0VYB5_CASCN
SHPWVLLFSLCSESLDGAYTVEMGQNAYLPCSYTPSTLGKLVPVCWGKGPCPVLSCQNLLLRTDEKNVNFQKSRRYELKGKLHKGNVTLTILNVTLADSGTYCCRVEIPGLMNDEKSNTLRVSKGDGDI